MDFRIIKIVLKKYSVCFDRRFEEYLFMVSATRPNRIQQSTSVWTVEEYALIYICTEYIFVTPTILKPLLENFKFLANNFKCFYTN